jgi:hypothetical protein
MKKTILLLVLMTVFGACLNTRINKKQNVFNITVIDKNNNSTIDSVKVVFTTIIDSRDVIEDIKYTNKYGICSISKDHDPLAQYIIRAEKNGYIGYYDKSYKELDRSFAYINESSGNNTVLYLTSDSLNQKKFWDSEKIRYEMDTLINLLKSNKYPLRSEFPKLLWEDIPKLLSIGNNKALINKYPISVLSSSINQDCYTGIVALWFIESIRITELKNSHAPKDEFPSLTPALRHSDNTYQGGGTNTELLDKAYQYYFTWWNEVKSLDKKQACKINPLKNSNINW